MSSTARKLKLRKHYNTLSSRFGFSSSICRYLSKDLYTKTNGDLSLAILTVLESLKRPRLGSELRKKYPKEYLRPFSKEKTLSLITFLKNIESDQWKLFKKPESDDKPIG